MTRASAISCCRWRNDTGPFVCKFLVFKIHKPLPFMEYSCVPTQDQVSGMCAHVSFHLTLVALRCSATHLLPSHSCECPFSQSAEPTLLGPPLSPRLVSAQCGPPSASRGLRRRLAFHFSSQWVPSVFVVPKRRELGDESATAHPVVCSSTQQFAVL